MDTFTKNEAIELLLAAFPALPLPKIRDDGIFYSSAYAFNWLRVKGKRWTEVCQHEVESFAGFSSVSGEIPAEYFFYYLPAALVAVFDDENYSDIVYRSLLPHKLDQRWKNYFSILNIEQVHALIIFLRKCQSSINLFENVMEMDILIEALEGL